MTIERSDGKRKDLQSLPKIAQPQHLGAVCMQWTKCGKAGCRCARGELHGPYAYVFWRENGRLRKTYVRVADTDDLRAAYASRRAREICARRRQLDGLSVWRDLTGTLREMARHED